MKKKNLSRIKLKTMMSKRIATYQDLIDAKTTIKKEIIYIENSIKDNKFIKVSSSIIEGKSLKEPLLDSLQSINLKTVLASPLGSLASTFLLSNKFIRKYFITFAIIKETVPYAFNKIKEMIDESELSKKSK